MSIAITLYIIVLYLIISYIVFCYKKKKHTQQKEIESIVVLGSKHKEIFKSRISYMEEIAKKYKYKSIYYTGSINSFGLKNFIISKNTFDDAIQVRRLLGKTKIMLITSRLHSRRAFNTFSKLYNKEEIDIEYSPDLNVFYTPFNPIGWFIAFSNIVKDIYYNNKTNNFTYLECKDCGRIFLENEKKCDCSYCGSYLDVITTKKNKHFKKILKNSTKLWDFFEILPIKNKKNIVSIFEPFSPIINIGDNIYLKLDYLTPSGSYKDRGATFLCSKCKELGIDELIEDSSGNAGGAIAIYCKKGNIKCHIFMPKNNSIIKKQQIVSFTPYLHEVDGNREKCYINAFSYANTHNILYYGHLWNPYFLQGIKTIAYELLIQNNWDLDCDIILPIGSGNLIIGLYMGLQDLINNNIIKKLPRIIGIQSCLCNTLDENNNTFGESIAEGINIPRPPRKLLQHMHDF